MNISKIVASWFGIGYIKGGGTIAAVITCIILYFLQGRNTFENIWILPAATLIVTLIGILTGNRVEADWGKDSYRVVIDEVAGQMIALLFIPLSVLNLIVGLVLFRFFDILKPLGIRKMENLPAGTGVMMDDVLAGVYANIILQIILLLTARF